VVQIVAQGMHLGVDLLAHVDRLDDPVFRGIVLASFDVVAEQQARAEAEAETQARTKRGGR
jgi:hypothetical protein